MSKPTLCVFNTYSVDRKLWQIYFLSLLTRTNTVLPVPLRTNQLTLWGSCGGNTRSTPADTLSDQQQLPSALSPQLPPDYLPQKWLLQVHPATMHPLWSAPELPFAPSCSLPYAHTNSHFPPQTQRRRALYSKAPRREPLVLLSNGPHTCQAQIVCSKRRNITRRCAPKTAPPPANRSEMGPFKGW